MTLYVWYVESKDGWPSIDGPLRVVTGSAILAICMARELVINAEVTKVSRGERVDLIPKTDDSAKVLRND